MTAPTFEKEGLEAIPRDFPAADAATSSTGFAGSDAGQWLPIETAPADVFLGFAPHSMGGYCLVACRNIDGEPASTDTGTVHKFTHWTPLPVSPAVASESAKP